MSSGIRPARSSSVFTSFWPSVTAIGVEHRILDAELLSAGVVLGGLLLEVLAGAGLNLLGRVVVEALDRGDLRGLHVGDVLDGGEALGHQQLSDHLVDVQRFLEELGAFAELALAPLAILALGDDVDLPAGQLAGETDVLAAPADRQRQLLVGHHHLHAAGLLVHHHLGDFRRRQRVDQEGGLVTAPLDDVDLLALQLGDHRLHARAAHADAGPDRIDRGIVGDHRHLGAAARIARHRADLDDAVVDLRHLLREQLGHEAAVRPGEHDLRALGLATHVVDVAADPVADLEGLARDRLVAAHDALAAAEVDDHVAVLYPLGDAVDDLADAVLELLVLPLALGLAHLAGDDLAGGLGLHAAELERRQRLDVLLADKGVLVVAQRVGEALLGVVVDLLGVVVDHGDHAQDGRLAGLRVDGDPDVVLRPVPRARSLLDRFLDRLDDDLLLDRLLAGHRVGDLKQLLAIGGDAGDAHVRSSFSFSAARRAARASAPRFISSSVMTSLASLIQAKGIRAVSSSPSRSMAT